MIDYLDVDDLLQIAAGILPEVAVRDAGLLASSAHRPAAVVFGHETYPTFAEKAAALMHSLARNHALVDGNKRLAWAATRAFCLLNGKDLQMKVDEAEAAVVAAATGAVDVPSLAATIAAHLAD